ncbi:DnaD domain protein [Hespellia stercorisuis]|uniref:DnaD and phage-associated domain-containing protein n=1 Tax=Hespellia stercorisuis DSM 15480 TaxID=1121950 RepID=A0A1M6J3N9_9FIRM|nr:DnaD domain protein [Hespellia stercorisuis]SHJ41277.1 DnaD and phage-associated domain-containing protein [Hespellia stercorisuis DSM 15480]
MKTLSLKNKYQSNATIISNDFIDHCMIKANGEFVKVYLFLLRHLNDPCSNLTIATIADCLDNTEKDILRAFKYWEKEGLFHLERDADQKIIGVELEKAPVLACAGSAPTEPVHSLPSPKSEACMSPATDSPITPEAAPQKAIALDSFKAQKELKSLLFIAEQYLGKTLTKTDIETITYFYDGLGFSADLIEYLIESCVENGHKSIHYIQKVALSWSDSHIHTVEDAKARALTYNKNCYTVLNAFGIKGRAPAPAEVAYINKWTGEYGFSLDIVQEACARTISVTHQPSFEYTDTILKRWFENNVHHLTDISALDAAYQKSKQSKKASGKKAVTKSNNFEGRTYDMDSLEEQLLNSN